MAKRNSEDELTAVLPVPYWTVGNATFPERLKRLRLARGMTQKELALEAGCAWNLVYRWERGFNGPAPRTAKRVAGVLGVDPAELVDVSRTRREALGPTEANGLGRPLG